MDILIVEDDAERAERHRQALRFRGATFETAYTLRAAWDAVARRRFDLVLLDLFLPDGTALSLAGDLRHRHPDTAVLTMVGASIFAHGAGGGVVRTVADGRDLAEAVGALCGLPRPKSEAARPAC